MLRKDPGVAVAAALTLALGIGVNTTIFSVMNGVFFRALPFRAADRLVVLGEDNLHEYNWTRNPTMPRCSTRRNTHTRFADIEFRGQQRIIRRDLSGSPS
jgi:hypothetical protein